jgi:hypothetical protein
MRSFFVFGLLIGAFAQLAPSVSYADICAAYDWDLTASEKNYNNCRSEGFSKVQCQGYIDAYIDTFCAAAMDGCIY